MKMTDYHLTIGQLSMWATYQMGLPEGAYNMNYSWEVENVNIENLIASIRFLNDSQEIWRSRYFLEAGDICRVTTKKSAPSIEIYEIPTDSIQNIDHFLQEQSTKPFYLEKEASIRWKLITNKQNKWVIFLQFQHTFSDGWSMVKCINDLKIIYHELLQNKTPYLARSGKSSEDFVLFQKGYIQSQKYELSLSFWKSRLHGNLPTLQMPTDFPNAHELCYGNSMMAFQFPDNTTKELSSYCEKTGSTLFSTLFGIYSVLLHRYTSQTDLIIGTPTAGRGKEYGDLIGYYVNPVAIRSSMENVPFSIYLNQTGQNISEAFAHRDVPFATLASILEYERTAGIPPIFQTQFIFDDNNRFLNRHEPLVVIKGGDREVWDMGDMIWTRRSQRITVDPFFISLRINKVQDHLSASIEYRADLFRKDTISRFSDAFLTLLTGCLTNPDLSVGLISIVSDAEKHHCLERWNNTEYIYPASLNILDLFESQVRKNPGLTALVFNERRYSYQELSDSANQLANYLRIHGAVEGHIVGVCMERSIDMLVGLYGVLKAGAAYTPIDPELPKDRIRYLIEDSCIELLISHKHTLPEITPHTLVSINLDVEWEQIQEMPKTKPVIIYDSLEIAYMIYTSGSTGKPKGAINCHQAICNRLQWMQDTYPLDPSDTVLQKTPYSFDVSVWEFFWPLQVGACLTIAVAQGHRDPSYICKAITTHHITTLHFVPSMLLAFLDDPEVSTCTTLKRVFCSGEALSLSSVKRFYQTFPWVKLFNLYGPTEAAVDVTAWTCQPNAPSVSIGMPISNTKIFILDRNINPVPVGVLGELHIAGISLARGYHRRPALTAEKFIPDPYSESPGVRMYKSGDNVSYAPDGNIQYHGRLDFQVKIRGLRIELGEISTCLAKHPLVKENIVLVSETDHASKRLIAYVIPYLNQKIDSDSLYLFLKDFLPEYMIPTSFLFLESFPTTPNGKVDRKALPEPLTARSELEYTAPTNEVERILAHIWCKVLGRTWVGIHDNFFELGGDSILNFKIIGAASKQGVHFSPSNLFANQTIYKLAKLAMNQPNYIARQKNVTGDIPLTPIQHWFFEQFNDGNNQWNMAASFKLDNMISPEAVETALKFLIRHHDALRIRFNQLDGIWKQWNADVEDDLILKTLDSGDSKDLSSELQILQTSLNHNQGPLIAALLYTAPKESQLYLAIHHLAMDGVSWRILEDDLALLLVQLQAGKALHLPLKTTSFQEWSLALDSFAKAGSLDTERAYWQNLINQKVARVPVVENGPNLVSSEVIVSHQLTEEQTNLLTYELPKLLQTTVNDLLLAALAQSIFNWIGGCRLLVDMEGHGREDILPGVNLSRTVGWFTSMFPVLIDGSANPNIIQTIKSLHDTRKERPHNGIGFGVLHYLSSPFDYQRGQILFNYLGHFSSNTEGPVALSHKDCGPTRADRKRTHIFEINAHIAQDQLTINWHFSTNLHQRSLIQLLCLDMVNTLVEISSITQETPSPQVLERTSSVPAGDIDNPVQDAYPLTPVQEGILFHTNLNPNSGVYLVQTGWEIQGAIDKVRFSDSWMQAIQFFGVLRTRFDQVNDKWVQQVMKQVPFNVEYIDFSAKQIDLSKEIEMIIQREQSVPMNICQPPLMRVVCISISESSHYLIWTNHHLILDGWSWPLVLSRVFKTYTGSLESDHGENEEIPFSRFVSWQNSLPPEYGKEFWQILLEERGAPNTLGFKSPEAEPGLTRFKSQSILIDRSTSHRLASLAKTHHVSLSTLIQSAWTLLLSHYFSDNDVMFGVTVSGRPAQLDSIESMVGMFINTLPFRVKLNTESPFLELMKSTQQIMFSLNAYESCALSDIQGWSQIPRDASLFDSIFVYENYPMEQGYGLSNSGLSIELKHIHEETNFPLVFVVFPGPDNIKISITHALDKVAKGTVTRILSHFSTLTDSITSNMDQNLHNLVFMPPSERRALLFDLCLGPVDNTAFIPFPKMLDLRRHGNNKAIFSPYPDQHAISYTELEDMSNILAAHLIGCGVRAETAVAVCMARSANLLVALIAVLKTGAHYIPMDPSFPPDRLKFMAEDAQVGVVIVDCLQLSIFPEAQNIIFMDTQKITDNADFKIPEICSDSLAYIIYTSGSTGRPKGVQVSHGGLANFLISMLQQPGISSSDTLLAVTTLSFDIAGLELFLPLLVGAKIVLPDADTTRDGRKLLTIINDFDVTFLQATPITWRLLLEEGWSSNAKLKALCGGEPLPVNLANEILERTDQLWNMYGPTETTIWSTQQHISKDEIISVGKAIRNTEVYIVDRELKLVPQGIPGELLIGGCGLARGYFRRSALTAQQFIPNPFLTQTPGGKRLYRTGDLVRCLEDGTLECLGRIDHQVKLRGFRIELGEIESCLNEFPAISKAVVVIRDLSPGNPALIAYVLPDSNRLLDPSEVNLFLSQKLPYYMVPGRYVTLTSFPLTPNNKIDRKALPSPTQESGVALLPPGNEIERKLLGYWQEILALQQIGVDQDFFRLGGHSLLITRLQSRIRSGFGIDVELSQFFSKRTVQHMTKLIEALCASNAQDSGEDDLEYGEI